MRAAKKTWSRATSGSLLLALAVGLGIATAALTLAWLRSQDGEAATEVVAEASVPKQTVVVAREAIPSGTQLDAALLQVVVLDASAAATGALDSLSDAVGMTTRYPLARGEQVLETKLVDRGSGEGLAFSIPDGSRAVSVPFSEVMGAGGLVVPGDRVDVLVATQYERLFGPGAEMPPGIDGAQPTVVTVLQNMLVLAIGQQFTSASTPESDAGETRVAGTDAQPGAGSITLAVTQEEAQVLFLATREGALGLALRKFGDGHEGLVAPAFTLAPLDGLGAAAVATSAR